ncbi:hypothetical protein PPERSA_03057 [Pseudocohnilembus persalinus]|uniref:Uncharacterized protein n=1 Tax=Pseudocohnilembus persalinus TaxID=266149 RepID=A0A0V0R928_PSEPJ|nr:hypothetical protein PPERSA_03057 [Pseudocohnilembus persalinus]|eukprot:KRX10999.1 hypothetical protein PPERSA_03057 [Pseudocohnilembus persalinus]
MTLQKNFSKNFFQNQNSENFQKANNINNYLKKTEKKIKNQNIFSYQNGNFLNKSPKFLEDFSTDYQDEVCQAEKLKSESPQKQKEQFISQLLIQQQNQKDQIQQENEQKQEQEEIEKQKEKEEEDKNIQELIYFLKNKFQVQDQSQKKSMPKMNPIDQQTVRKISESIKKSNQSINNNNMNLQQILDMLATPQISNSLIDEDYENQDQNQNIDQKQNKQEIQINLDNSILLNPQISNQQVGSQINFQEDFQFLPVETAKKEQQQKNQLNLNQWDINEKKNNINDYNNCEKKQTEVENNQSLVDSEQQIQIQTQNSSIDYQQFPAIFGQQEFSKYSEKRRIYLENKNQNQQQLQNQNKKTIKNYYQSSKNCQNYQSQKINQFYQPSNSVKSENIKGNEKLKKNLQNFKDFEIESKKMEQNNKNQFIQDTFQPIQQYNKKNQVNQGQIEQIGLAKNNQNSQNNQILSGAQNFKIENSQFLPQNQNLLYQINPNQNSKFQNKIKLDLGERKNILEKQKCVKNFQEKNLENLQKQSNLVNFRNQCQNQQIQYRTQTEQIETSPQKFFNNDYQLQTERPRKQKRNDKIKSQQFFQNCNNNYKEQEPLFFNFNSLSSKRQLQDCQKQSQYQNQNQNKKYCISSSLRNSEKDNLFQGKQNFFTEFLDPSLKNKEQFINLEKNKKQPFVENLDCLKNYLHSTAPNLNSQKNQLQKKQGQDVNQVINQIYQQGRRKVSQLFL